MSENCPTHVAVFSSRRSAARLALLSAAAVGILLGVYAAPSLAQVHDYVAPARAHSDWLDDLAAGDRAPLEAWIAYLPPTLDERLRWIGLEADAGTDNPPRWSDWFGKVVVVQSWTSANRESVNRLEEAAKVAAEFSDIDVQFIAYHTPQGAAVVDSFIDSRGNWQHLTVVDPVGEYSDLLGFYLTPTNIVIGRNGAIRYAGLTPDGLREAIDHLLDEDSHSVASRGLRPIGESRSASRGTATFPPHNNQPRANNLQGQRAPEFSVQSWANHAPDQIEGRVNVIKFWRTNCPHCISAIPKTTELAQKYAGRVNFIDITQENQAALEQGLAQRRRPLDTIGHHIASDPSGRMNAAVRPQGVPNAMIIDSDWIVRWQGHPAHITEQMLDQILAADGGGGGGEIVRRWTAPLRDDSAARGERSQPQPATGPGMYPPHNNQPRANNLQGQRAPDFFVQSWANHEPDQIEGRVNVIKFWRTNCPHCINVIPKTTELAQTYAGRVNFIDITQENQAAIEQGLRQRGRPLDTIGHHIASDPTGRLNSAVRPQGVPNAMVIDSNWIVRWQGHPAQINEQMLDQILAADGGVGGEGIAQRPTAPAGEGVRVRPAEDQARPLTERPRLNQPPQQRQQQRVQRRNIQFGPAEFPPSTGGDVRAEVDLRGKPGPEFHAEQWVTAQPLGVGGKVTVIEFFRTNCPHCRNAIPKLNELNAQFAGAVDIITLSSERREVFDQGLVQHRLTPQSFNHFVALDPSMKVHNAFRPRGVPYAVILDSNWIVRWQGHPASITPELLEQIVVADAWKRRQGS